MFSCYRDDLSDLSLSRAMRPAIREYLIENDIGLIKKDHAERGLNSKGYMIFF